MHLHINPGLRNNSDRTCGEQVGIINYYWYIYRLNCYSCKINLLHCYSDTRIIAHYSIIVWTTRYVSTLR